VKKIGIIEQQLKDDFLTQMISQSYAYDTIKTYSCPMDRFLRFLNSENINEIQNVSESDIDKYRLSLVKDNFKSASLEVYLRTIRLFFKYLENEGIIFINPTADLKVPKADRSLQYIPSVKEMEKFLNFNTDSKERLRNKAMFELAYSCGARRNEIRMVDLKDLDLISGEVKLIGKGDIERLVPLGRTAVYWLNKYLSESRPKMIKDKNEVALFLARRGNRLTKTGIHKQVEYVRDVTKTKVTMHSIRRAFATHLLRNGASPFVIQKLLGHSSLKHLSQYLNVTITDLKKMHNKSVVGQ
jgi:integrase/recombinase XerD